jgi:hypothetical protein
VESREIEWPEGYLTVKVPGGIVVISAGLVDTRTGDPVVVVNVDSKHACSPDADDRLWTVDEYRSYGKPGETKMRGVKWQKKGEA